jgi:hypothetical protein
MPSKKRKSEVVIRGPAKIHRADCSTIQVGLGGEIRMTNEQWKGWIEGGGKIISDLAGKVLAFEAAGEISNSIVSDEEFSTDVAIARADTQTDFRLMRTNGQPLAFVYKEGNNTFAEAVAPAATGKVWVGFQTEQFQKTDLADLSALDDIIVRLHVAQWTPTPHSVVAGRFSMILRNLTDGVNEQEVISAIINPLSPVPVVNCVSPRALSMGGRSDRCDHREELPGRRERGVREDPRCCGVDHLNRADRGYESVFPCRGTVRCCRDQQRLKRGPGVR